MPSSTAPHNSKPRCIAPGVGKHIVPSVGTFRFLETVSPSTYQVQKVHVVSTQTHSFTGFPNPCAPRWRNLGRRQPESTLGPPCSVLKLKQSSLSIMVKLGALWADTSSRSSSTAATFSGAAT